MSFKCKFREFDLEAQIAYQCWVQMSIICVSHFELKLDYHLNRDPEKPVGAIVGQKNYKIKIYYF